MSAPVIIDRFYEEEQAWRATYVMFSGSVAHSPTALVTLTRSAWFVPVSRLTRDGIPPDFLMTIRLAGCCAHCPSAPTTVTRTSSGWLFSKLTNLSMVFNSSNLYINKQVNHKEHALLERTLIEFKVEHATTHLRKFFFLLSDIEKKRRGEQN